MIKFIERLAMKDQFIAKKIKETVCLKSLEQLKGVKKRHERYMTHEKKQKIKADSVTKR